MTDTHASVQKNIIKLGVPNGCSAISTQESNSSVLDDLYLQEAFKSTTGSGNRYIDPASAEGSYILEVIKKLTKS
jgi:hypothetical protein